MKGRILIALLASSALATPSFGQFQFFGNGVTTYPGNPGARHGSRIPVSSATYSYGSIFDTHASQNNQACVNGSCGGTNGHMISGPFSAGQVFVCGSTPQGVNARPCNVSKYFTRPICPRVLMWSANAGVSTRRGNTWTPFYTSNAGVTGCYKPQPPPPIEPCGDGAAGSEYVVLPLDGLVSSSRKVYAVPDERLRKFETVANKSFFVNEYVVAERIAGQYVPVGRSNHTAIVEALENINAATPRPGFAPDRVLALKVARHRRAGHHPPRVQLDLSDGPSQINAASRFDGPAIPADATWRFVVALDIRDSLNMAREAEVLWSERDVPAAFLGRLLGAVTAESHDQAKPGHRLIVYVVVAVTGTTMKIEQQTEVEPRCCCSEVLCP